MVFSPSRVIRPSIWIADAGPQVGADAGLERAALHVDGDVVADLATWRRWQTWCACRATRRRARRGRCGRRGRTRTRPSPVPTWPSAARGPRTARWRSASPRHHDFVLVIADELDGLRHALTIYERCVRSVCSSCCVPVVLIAVAVWPSRSVAAALAGVVGIGRGVDVFVPPLPLRVVWPRRRASASCCGPRTGRRTPAHYNENVVRRSRKSSTSGASTTSTATRCGTTSIRPRRRAAPVPTAAPCSTSGAARRWSPTAWRRVPVTYVGADYGGHHITYAKAKHDADPKALDDRVRALRRRSVAVRRRLVRRRGVLRSDRALDAARARGVGGRPRAPDRAASSS